MMLGIDPKSSCTFALILLLASIANAAEPPAPSYERDVRPILARHCTTCHNASKKEKADVSGGLALDSFEAISAGTTRHKVVVAGKAAESTLIKRLSDPDEDRRMPLSDEPLPAVEQAIIRRWIDAGMPRGPAPAMAKASPEGKTNSGASSGAPRPIFWRRSTDVALPLELTVPDGAAGLAKGGLIRIVVKAGPLPPVSSLAIRGDGRILAAGTYGQVVLWDLVDARPISVIGGIPGPVHALGFSRDGKRLAIGAGIPARSGVVRIVDVPGGEPIHEFEGHDDVVFGLAFRPDGGQIASASFDQSIRLWSLTTGKPEGAFRGHSDFVEAIVYTKDGRSLLSAGKDRTIKRIDAKTLKEMQTYSSHDDDVLSLALHPDGIRFVSAGNEPQLRWWSLDAAQPTKLEAVHSGPVHQLAFSRDGRRLVSASGDGSTRIWDGTTGAHLRALAGTSEWQYSAAISDDGRLAAAGGWDGLIHVWDAESGVLRATLLQVPVNPSAASGSLETDWMALTPQGYLAGSSPMLDLARAKVGDATVAAAILRNACVNPELTARAIRGEAVPPIKFAPGGK